MNEIKISLVPAEHLNMVWGRIVKMIEAALVHSGGRYSKDDIYDDIKSGEQTLWIAFDNVQIVGIATVRIIQYPHVRALCYENLAGKDVTSWLEAGHVLISQYAKDHGCTMLECQGRSGWKPFLEKLGYKQYAVRYQMELED